MKKSEILTALETGAILALAEWRSAVAKSGISKAKTTDGGRPTESRAWGNITHNVEINNEAVPVVQFLKPAEAALFNADKWNASPKPFTKGQKVVIHVESIRSQNFKRELTGHCEALE